MDVHTNIPLKNYTTMKLGGNARFMTEVHTPDELAEAIRNAKSQNIAWFILGGGSNVVARDDGFNGLVIRNGVPGFEIIEQTASTATIKIGAGESWDDTVKRVVEMGLSGIEALSAIPGTAGAAPVQNIGAYGQEISETLVSLDAYDSQTDQFVTLSNTACEFSYRNSIFRSTEKGRYAIISITLNLYHTSPQPPFYAALEKYFTEHGVTLFTPQIVRDAVIAIRKDKLPDPQERPNAGSFFKNAIVEEWQLAELKKNWPDMPTYDLGNKTYKVPTGWLIEQAGFKGKLLHGIRVHDKNCLVLINETAGGYADLAAARSEIMGTIRDTFRITIEQEPLEL